MSYKYEQRATQILREFTLKHSGISVSLVAERMKLRNRTVEKRIIEEKPSESELKRIYEAREVLKSIPGAMQSDIDPELLIGSIGFGIETCDAVIRNSVYAPIADPSVMPLKYSFVFPTIIQFVLGERGWARPRKPTVGVNLSAITPLHRFFGHLKQTTTQIFAMAPGGMEQRRTSSSRGMASMILWPTGSSPGMPSSRIRAHINGIIRDAKLPKGHPEGFPGIPWQLPETEAFTSIHPGNVNAYYMIFHHLAICEAWKICLASQRALGAITWAARSAGPKAKHRRMNPYWSMKGAITEANLPRIQLAVKIHEAIFHGNHFKNGWMKMRPLDMWPCCDANEDVIG